MWGWCDLSSSVESEGRGRRKRYLKLPHYGVRQVRTVINIFTINNIDLLTAQPLVHTISVSETMSIRESTNTVLVTFSAAVVRKGWVDLRSSALFTSFVNIASTEPFIECLRFKYEMIVDINLALYDCSPSPPAKMNTNRRKYIFRKQFSVLLNSYLSAWWLMTSIGECRSVKIPAQSGFYSHKLNIIV